MYPTKKLSEITSLITKGSTPTTYGYSFLSEGINFIKIENLSNGIIDKSSLRAFISEEAHLSQKRSILEHGDFLVSIAGTIGSIADILPANTNQALAIVRGYQNFVNKDFLRYIFLSSLSNGFKKKARGGALQNISLEDIKNIEIPLPPLSTQSNIVAKLDEAFSNIDRQIGLLKKNIEDVENMKKSVLEESFQSGEYEIKTLGDITEIITGNTPPTKFPEYYNGDYFWAGPGDFGEFKIISTTNKTLSEKGIIEGKARIIQKGAVMLVAIGATIGKVGIAGIKMSTNQQINSFEVDERFLNNEYLYYFFRKIKNFFLEKSSQTTLPILNKSQCKDLEIPLPSLLCQHEIVAHLDIVFDTTRKLRKEYEEQIRDLVTMKQSLLEEAFAGRLVEEK